MGSRAEQTAKMMEMTPFEKADAWFRIAGREGYDGHDSILPKHLMLISAVHNPTPSNPHQAITIFEMIVPSTLCNMGGNLHGGAVALIFDICTSVTIPICAKEEFWDSGSVSRTLNCTYLRPVKQGQKILVESQVVHLGKRMGVVNGVIKLADGEGKDAGKICYTCEHGKAALGPSL